MVGRRVKVSFASGDPRQKKNLTVKFVKCQGKRCLPEKLLPDLNALKFKAWKSYTPCAGVDKKEDPTWVRRDAGWDLKSRRAVEWDERNFKCKMRDENWKRDRDMLRFEGRIGERTSISGIIVKLKLRVTLPHRDIRKYYLLYWNGLNWCSHVNWGWQASSLLR